MGLAIGLWAVVLTAATTSFGCSRKTTNSISADPPPSSPIDAGASGDVPTVDSNTAATDSGSVLDHLCDLMDESRPPVLDAAALPPPFRILPGDAIAMALSTRKYAELKARGLELGIDTDRVECPSLPCTGSEDHCYYRLHVSADKPLAGSESSSIMMFEVNAVTGEVRFHAGLDDAGATVWKRECLRAFKSVVSCTPK